MTFTFTLDAFPDYTKFNPTKKVLAAIQVITDESGETEGIREQCEEMPETVTPYAGSGIKATFISNDVEAGRAIIEATGKVVGQEYNTTEFSGLTGKGGQITIKGFDKAIEEQQSLTREDPTFIITVADKDPVTKPKAKLLSDGVSVVVGEDTAGQQFKVRVQEQIGGSGFDKTYIIVNNVEFAEAASPASYSVRSSATSSDDE